MWRILLGAWIATSTAFSAIVDGQVVNSVTGDGIMAVTVTLMQQEHTAYTATTDGHGRFQIDGVKDGVYTPRYRRNAIFIPPPELLPAGAAFQVSGEGSAVHLEARLPPAGKLSGRVLDAGGAPIPGAILTLTLQRGGYKFTQRGVADTKGDYHFDDLPFPGAVSIGAAAPPQWNPPEKDDGQNMGWAAFYPGVTDPEGAARIELPPGGELRDLDIKLTAVPVHRIRGVVVDPRGVPAAGASLYWINPMTLPRVETAKSDGTFEFPFVADGSWGINASLARGDGVMLKTHQAVQVNGHDVEVKLNLEAPFSIQGKVVVEVPDGFPAPELPKLKVGNQIGVPDRTSEFTIKDLYPGPYPVQPDPPPAGYYLDSIRLGSSRAPGPQVQILWGDQPLTLTYKHGGGTVRGTIESCGGGELTLMPVDVALRHLTIIRKARCDANSKFEIPAVRPGRYYAFALPFNDRLSPFDDLDNALIQQSTIVTVVDRELVSPEIRLRR
jgi:hypothetical protein